MDLSRFIGTPKIIILTHNLQKKNISVHFWKNKTTKTSNN